MSENADVLAQVPFFQLLDAQEREELASELAIVEVPAGELVFELGQPGESLYIVKKGAVEIFFKDDTGQPIILETGGPGHLFGELSLLDKGPRTASVRVTEDMEALRLERHDLDQFLRTHPAAAMDLLAAMGRRLRVTAELLRHTASRNVNDEVEDKR